MLAPLAAVVAKSADGGWHHFWQAAWNREARAALELTFELAGGVVAVNAITGTALAWTLVRDEFPGKRLVNTVIDLPFALPTIVAGLVLVALYGPSSPVGVNVYGTRTAIVLALLFVTLPFVVRTVQPVLIELDTEMEEAARSLGAREPAVFRRIVLPNILPGVLSGVTLAFARAIGEIGAVVIISGNLPYRTELSSVFIYNRIQSGDRAGAAAVAVLLLAISFVLLLAVGALRRLATRHDAAA